MNSLYQLLQYKIWDKDDRTSDLYRWLLIASLSCLFAAYFYPLYHIFGPTARIFPLLFLVIAALSWGLSGGLLMVLLTTILDILLHMVYGYPYAGGFIGPMGYLFATSIVGVLSDFARQLDRQVVKYQQAQVAIENQEKRYRTVFNQISDGVVIVDTGYNIVDVNDTAVFIYGYKSKSELIGMTLAQLMSSHSEDEYEAVQKAITGAAPQQEILTNFRRDGTEILVEVSGSVIEIDARIHYLVVVGDISFRLSAAKEKERLLAQLHESQRMESIGTLAGGIAHDFNNLLMSILGNATLALLNLQPEDPLASYLLNIKRISNTGATLTKQLLGFARGGKYDPKPTNLNDLIDHQNHLFRRTSKSLTIHTELEKNLWPTEIDRSQIEQVLLNIYVNSQQAMPNGGSLDVKTENYVSGENGIFPFRMRKGRYVRLIVRDTGIGMDEMTQRRIFEPFFTTKDKGKGTGLGMASAYGIVKNHKGYIHVESELGKGTTVTVFLPATEKLLQGDITHSIESVSRGLYTVLLVDDEESIIEVTSEMLIFQGYDVIPARSGQEAIDIYESRSQEIDLIILDVVMPEMNGLETLKRLRMIDPDVIVLISSGQSAEEQDPEIITGNRTDFIQKPFDIGTLSQKIDALVIRNVSNGKN